MPIPKGVKRLWATYNHMPGGHVVATHFEDVTRRRILGGDRTEDVHFSAQDQLKNFEKSDFVALYVNGILHKNKLLVYDGPDPGDHPKAADMVIEWALAKGQTAVPSKGDGKKVSETPELSKRVDALDKRIDRIDSKLDLLLEKKGA